MKNSIQQFDIDLVYLWVDGNDKKWIAKKNAFIGKKDIPEATLEGRFINNDELRYALRSVQKYAGWIRKIFIVTDEQTPEWLNTENPNIQVVDIREILPTEALPCYNSVVIEYFLYKIPGLSEHFLYSNDDMFLNRPVEPQHFFDLRGLPIIRLQRSPLSKQINSLKRLFQIHTNIYRKTIDFAARLVEKKFNTYYSGTPHHNIDAYLLSDNRKVVEEVFFNEINLTINNHFRTEKDVQRIIFSYYALAVNKGILNYVNRNTSCRIRMNYRNFGGFILKYQPVFFCLNDSTKATHEDRLRAKPFLENLFPEKSDFEK